MFKIKCQKCNGTGTINCICCGADSECSECDGTGFIPEERQTNLIIPRVILEINTNGSIKLTPSPVKPSSRWEAVHSIEQRTKQEFYYAKI